jgi:hypothetical protein
MISLFEQLGKGISLSGGLRQQEPQIDHEKISHMKFTQSLLQHLDKVYGKMIAKEMFNESDEYIVEEVQGIPRHEYYSPGHSAVTESA